MSMIARMITTAAVLLCVALLGRIGLAAQPPGVAVTTEAWRLGMTSEGDARIAALIGRDAGIAASFRSNRSVSDIFFILPASARALNVETAAYHLLQRSGTYTGTASLALEVRSANGTLQHTVSSAPIDLQAAATGAWADLALSATPADLAIEPGEHLVFRFALDGGSAGNLDVRPVFEVIVTNDPGVTATLTATPTSTSTPTTTPITTSTTTSTPTATPMTTPTATSTPTTTSTTATPTTTKTPTATTTPAQKKVYLPLVMR
jgi:hypothetical protein